MCVGMPRQSQSNVHLPVQETPALHFVLFGAKRGLFLLVSLQEIPACRLAAKGGFAASLLRCIQMTTTAKNHGFPLLTNPVFDSTFIHLFLVKMQTINQITRLFYFMFCYVIGLLRLTTPPFAETSL